jgi:hypothetical protein
MASDYNYFNSYTTGNSFSTDLTSLFKARKYSQLYFNNNSRQAIISDLLSNGVHITITFPTSGIPNINGENMLRNPNPEFAGSANDVSNTEPDNNAKWYFRNTLIDMRNTSSSKDLDVDKTGAAGGDTSASYASMYIIAVGLDTTNYSNFTSLPNFIGFFALPLNQ